jgi:carbonic anhydrase
MSKSDTKKISFKVILICACLLPGLAFSADPPVSNEMVHHLLVRSFLKGMFDDNAEHVSEISHEHFKSFAEQQSPRATILSCSDSRVQFDAFYKRPVNDLFAIRNIGNQIKTTEGSVEYGINHLHTQFLIIIGHSNCGAIHTALGNYSQESKAIRVELDHLHLSPKIKTNEGVIENVHNQVAYALEKFKGKIDTKELIVVGAVYDFRDDFKRGHGRLILINLNGERDPAKIKESEYIKGFDNIAVGIKK